ncbi:MAG: DUF2207 domain-containing protein [Bacilli bacterium]|nr:DUF2207 domain-containing protein [Bacilli bacterium]
MTKVFKKKKSLFPKIMAIIIIAIFLFSCISLVEMMDFGEVSDFASFVAEIQKEPIAVAIIVGTLLAILLFNPFSIILMIYYVVKGARKMSRIKNRAHPKFNIEYFRDDLSEVSPAIASVLVDLELNDDIDISAHVLKLLLDGYIKEEDNRYVVTNKDSTNLLESDRKLLEFVASDFRNVFLLKSYKKSVFNDALNLGYLKVNDKSKTIIKMFLIPFLISIFTIIIFFGASVLINVNIVLAVILIILSALFDTIFIFWVPIGIIIYIFMSAVDASYRRTKSGNALLEQIMGLKNFLTDFSDLKNSSSEEMVLREYYIVYALVLGINDTIDDEVLSKIKNQMQQKSSILC